MIYIKAEAKCDGFKPGSVYEYCPSKCEISLIICEGSTRIVIGEHDDDIRTTQYEVAERPEGWQIYLGEVNRHNRYAMTLCPDCIKKMNEEEKQRAKFKPSRRK